MFWGVAMISIIIPVYNCIQSLEKCIRSIQNQTISDWELLLIDDGSRDGSGEKCDLFAETDRRIRVFHKPNGGVSSARNLGLDHANGQFVMFCDSDDWVDPDWCRQLHHAAVNNKDCLPLCNYFRAYPRSEDINHPEICAEIKDKIDKRDFFSLNRPELLGIPWNKIFRMEIIQREKIRFNQNLTLGEDLVFVLDYLHSTEGDLYYLNQPLYHYSINNPQSLSAKYYPDLAGIYRVIYGRIKREMDSMPGCDEQWLNEYGKSCFFAYDRIFRNTWSKDNHRSLLQKWFYNIKIFHSEEYRLCRKLLKKGTINCLQYSVLRTHSFIIYWTTVTLTEKISKLRRRGR